MRGEDFVEVFGLVGVAVTADEFDAGCQRGVVERGVEGAEGGDGEE